ncbi:MAG: hypothetical protein RLZZ236_389 [Bacteroidota bacterium]|jgi:hypothetical protein
MKKNNFIQLGLLLFSILIGVSALSVTTDLNSEKLVSIPAADLTSAYQGLQDFTGHGLMFGLNELSTDELVAPTRGGDWDDNGMWRQLHTHRWGPSHSEVRSTWNSLFRNAETCNKVIKYGTTSEKLQAQFLKAFYYYNFIDLFGQVPYSETGLKYFVYENNDVRTDIKVLTRSEATDLIISELESILNNLPARTINDASIANKDAAHFLLAKIYLNKAVFKATNLAGPYVFNASDMTKVIQHVDALTNTLATNYWSNFAPNNNTSSEIIFSSKNNRGSGGAMQSKWRMGNHYNQTPDGWNGFTTVADYYSTFNATDNRAHYAVPSYTFTVDANGKGLGFLQGQVYKNGIVSTANALKDRYNNPLNFTASISLITSSTTGETAGIRGIKYIPDAANLIQPDNDLVLMRYADALLMKAEAILRGGTGTGAIAILNSLATRAGVNTVTSASLDAIYAERGRELWWEGWRRNDMIRFGKYLNSRELKPFVSNSKYLLFPIPTEALYNVNIKQNPGY